MMRPSVSAFPISAFCFTQQMRLQKYLAQAGVASRRASVQLIQDGRVTVNGKTITEPGHAVDETRDEVSVDGDQLTLPTQHRTILLYKPRGYICSASAAQGKTVLELIDGIEGRLFPVGRLDKDSEGLLLLTDDGDLANRLTHPRYEHRKRYEVTVSGNVTPETLVALNGPMMIDDYETRPARVTLEKQRRESGKTLLIFELKEGRNRQIRKMCEAVGLRIHRLTRTHINDLTLQDLHPGQWRELSEEELKAFHS
jgi:pseudouridine synthase